MADTVKFWDGAVTLTGAARGSSAYATLIVWFRDGKVVRRLTQPLDDDKIGGLSSELASVYGQPMTTRGAVTTWSLKDGATAKLDVGAALSLVVDPAK
jgi:hypothetical protein